MNRRNGMSKVIFLGTIGACLLMFVFDVHTANAGAIEQLEKMSGQKIGRPKTQFESPSLGGSLAKTMAESILGSFLDGLFNPPQAPAPIYKPKPMHILNPEWVKAQKAYSQHQLPPIVANSNLDKFVQSQLNTVEAYYPVDIPQRLLLGASLCQEAARISESSDRLEEASWLIYQGFQALQGGAVEVRPSGGLSLPPIPEVPEPTMVESEVEKYASLQKAMSLKIGKFKETQRDVEKKKDDLKKAREVSQYWKNKVDEMEGKASSAKDPEEKEQYINVLEEAKKMFNDSKGKLDDAKAAERDAEKLHGQAWQDLQSARKELGENTWAKPSSSPLE